MHGPDTPDRFSVTYAAGPWGVEREFPGIGILETNNQQVRLLLVKDDDSHSVIFETPIININKIKTYFNGEAEVFYEQIGIFINGKKYLIRVRGKAQRKACKAWRQKMHAMGVRVVDYSLIYYRVFWSVIGMIILYYSIAILISILNQK